MLQCDGFLLAISHFLKDAQRLRWAFPRLLPLFGFFHAGHAEMIVNRCLFFAIPYLSRRCAKLSVISGVLCRSFFPAMSYTFPMFINVRASSLRSSITCCIDNACSKYWNARSF